ncbi:MAG: PDGLE domain-containing protein [Dehalococcoidia bacterium]
MSGTKRWIVVGVVIALVIAGSSAWLASGSPDGLERVAEDKEFLHRAEDSGYEILPGYTVPGIDDERASTVLAGVIGVIVVGGIAFGAGRLLRHSKPGADGPAPGEQT